MLKSSIAFVMLAAACLHSAAAPPTRESVETLLDVTKARAMLEDAHKNVEQVIRQAFAQELAGRPMNDEQRRTIEIASSRIAELMRKEMNWETLAPIQIAIYQEAFDQAEIEGLIAFYKTPVGQSFVAKMPAVMLRTMSVMQVQMQSVMPKLKAAMDQVIRDAKLPPKT